MESLVISLPEHWLPPVLFGDTSRLAASEAAGFARWLRDTRRDVGHDGPVYVGAVRDRPYFEWCHDAADYGVPACMCIDVQLLVRASDGDLTVQTLEKE